MAKTKNLQVRPTTFTVRETVNGVEQDVLKTDLFAGIDFIKIVQREDMGGVAPAVLDNGQPKKGWGLFVRWSATQEGSGRADAVEHFRLFEAMPASVDAGGAGSHAAKAQKRVESMIVWMRADAGIDA